GNLEGLLDGVYETTPEHVGATLDEARLLSRLVEDLGTLALAESGQLQMSMAPLDVNDLLAESAFAYAIQAKSTGVLLRVEVAGDASPLIVNADAGRMQQMLGNLIANALRHTPKDGTVTLRTAKDQDAIHLEVEDTGEGISEDDLPFIFDRFWRGDRARTHKATVGGGLGLAIARQLVRDHGGDIHVSSSIGKGTTFTISLPSG
ncbi:MAG: HAMP domain-containing sensor histidine kinase, partial [Chloroflexi bacterium]|nr:HAMP domain-containing sensor histidine kinase [Chloroflexota bacterium]